jgi:hypothetical protein
MQCFKLQKWNVMFNAAGECTPGTFKLPNQHEYG